MWNRWLNQTGELGSLIVQLLICVISSIYNVYFSLSVSHRLFQVLCSCTYKWYSIKYPDQFPVYSHCSQMHFNLIFKKYATIFLLMGLFGDLLLHIAAVRYWLVYQGNVIAEKLPYSGNMNILKMLILIANFSKILFLLPEPTTVLPHRCMILKPWGILRCFPRELNGAAGTGTFTHIGLFAFKGRISQLIHSTRKLSYILYPSEFL